MTKSGFAKEHLKSFIDRIERLESEKAALAADISEVYKEAKGTGFDTKIIRKVIALRKLDKADFQEQAAVLDLYLTAVGMTPLFDFADSAPPPAPAAKSPTAPVPKELKAAVARLGTPVQPTDEEKEKGVVAAFEKDGTRMSIGFDPGKSAPAAQKSMDVTNEIPSFLLREQPKRQPATA